MISGAAKYRLAEGLGTLFGEGLRVALAAATALLPQNGRVHVRARAVSRLMQGLRTVDVRGIPLQLEMDAGADVSFHWSSEPETIEWLDEGMGEGRTLWDIGANIGLYTLWCAKRHPSCRVVAFEPNALTYPILVRHVIANGVADRVTVLPFALSGGPLSIEMFRLSSLLPGAAANQLEIGRTPPMSFGEVARYAVAATSADHLVELFRLTPPDLIKIDVDGIEPEILAGATRVLSTVRSVLVEDEHNTHRLEAIERPLHAAGLVEDDAYRSRGSGRNRVYRRPAG